LKTAPTFPLILFPPCVEIVFKLSVPPLRPPVEPIAPTPKVVSANWLFAPVVFFLMLIFLNVLSNYRLFGGFFALLLLGAAIPVAYFLFYLPQQKIINTQNAENERLYQQKMREYRLAFKQYQAKKDLPIPDYIRQDFYQNQLLTALEQAVRKPTKLRRAVQKGRSEEHFLPYLYQHFGKAFIKNNLQLGKFALPYVPDFCYIDEEKFIYIDIEIDEPYAALSGEPIHYLGADDARNDFFLSQGWTVVRFAEEQIPKYPEACCATIAQVLDYLRAKTAKISPNVPLVACWDKKTALEMAKNQHRQYYK